jgi:hypothetical protein
VPTPECLAQETQAQLDRQPRHCLNAKIGAMTAPWIVIGRCDHASFNRIKVDVAEQREKIRIDIDQERSMPTLEQMPSCAKALVPVPRILHRDALHDAAKRLIPYLNHRVQVIGHPTIRMHTRIALLDRVRHDGIQNQSIIRTRKDVLAVITTQNDVIATARHMQSR